MGKPWSSLTERLDGLGFCVSDEQAFEIQPETLRKYEKNLVQLKETILANTVLIGEIPAPTFGEQERVSFLLDRFRENQLIDVYDDEAGNATALLPGTKGDRNILVVSHVDTPFDAKVSHTMSLGQETASGVGIADNSLGVGVLALLPAILETLEVSLSSNLILLAPTKGLGRGNMEGLRFFLENVKTEIDAGVCVEGAKIGRLSYASLGMLRLEIECRQVSGSQQFSANSVIASVNAIIRRILEIPFPTEPRTSIILGSVQAGVGFKHPLKAKLRLEVRSENEEIVNEIHERIGEILAEMNANHETDSFMEAIARRSPGGIGFDHQLVKSTRDIMDALDIQPEINPSMSELASLIDHGIPAITLGITESDNEGELEESIAISPIFKGIAQLIGVIEAIDAGGAYGN